MSKRKTIPIKWLIDQVNEFNRTSANDLQAMREAKNILLEDILHECGQYAGFGYYDKFLINDDSLSIGVRDQLPDGSWDFENTDRTRIFYYYSRELRK